MGGDGPARRRIDGIAGGSGGKYPKLVADVKTLTRSVLKPSGGQNLNTQSVIEFSMTTMDDQFVK